MNRFIQAAPCRTFAAAGAIAIILSACNVNESASEDPTGAADSVATNVTWYSHATQFRDKDNLRVAYDCPENGTPATVWGTDVYTDDSSVCTAGVHAGKITLAKGGRVIIEIRPGEDSYDSLTRNGVTSRTWPQWLGSFVFL